MNFVKKSGLSIKEARLLLAIKLITGIIYSWFLLIYFPYGDYVSNNVQGIIGHERLLSAPGAFLLDWGQNNYPTTGEFFSADKSFWDDLSINLLEKVLAMLNFITGGDFLINSMLFSIAGFFGSLAIYRFFSRLGMHHYINIIGSFLLLSTLVFTTSLHKDCIVFFALGLFIYYIPVLFHPHTKNKTYFFFTMAWLLLLINRNYVAVIVIPAAAAFYFSVNTKFAAWKISAAMIFLIAIAGTIWILVVPEKNPSTVIASRQNAYMQKQGNSDLNLPKITGDYTSLVSTIPYALKNVIMEPNPFHYINIFFLLFGIETWIYLLIMLFAFILYWRKPGRPRKEILFTMTIVVFAFFILGLVVPNAGALLRYRSIYYPLLLIPCINRIYITLK